MTELTNTSRFLKHTFKFKGASSGSRSTPRIQASAPPPPTQTTSEVVQAKRDSRRQNSKKKGMNKTILAGETGGYRGAPSKGYQTGRFDRQIEDPKISGNGTLLGGNYG